MIRLYRTEDGELRPCEKEAIQHALWIDAVAPTPDEVDALHKQFDIDLQDVADCLDPNERARVEIEEGYDLLVLRTLLEGERTGEKVGERIQTMPIGIFATKKKIVTVRLVSSFSDVELTADLRRKPHIATREDLFLALVRKVNRDMDRSVRPMERVIASIQETLLAAGRAEAAPSAFSLSNNLIVLNTALLSNLNALSMMSKSKHLRLTKDQLDVAEDLENDMGQMYEMTTIYREVMANLLSAYESSLANSLQTVMKILTTISLILFIPIMITALFSMNLLLPLDNESPMAFWIVVVMSAVAVFALWIVFRIKRIL